MRTGFHGGQDKPGRRLLHDELELDKRLEG